MRGRAVGPMLGLAATVAGCGASQPATAPRADVASAVFSSSAREDGTLAAARRHLVRRCMTARGFTFSATAPAPPVPAADTPPSRAGYGLYAQFPKAAPRGKAPARPGFRRALMGSPRQTGTLHLPDGVTVKYRSKGCHAEAMGTLYGSVRRYQRLVAARNAVRSVAGERVARDLKLANALTGWTRCMKLRGLPYPSPDAARMGVYDAYLKASDRARVRPRELATAAADRYCAERTEIYPALARAQEDALRAMSSSERTTAIAIARARSTALDRARRALKGAHQGG
jgi:hypothetical protein